MAPASARSKKRQCMKKRFSISIVSFGWLGPENITLKRKLLMINLGKEKERGNSNPFLRY